MSLESVRQRSVVFQNSLATIYNELAVKPTFTTAEDIASELPRYISGALLSKETLTKYSLVAKSDEAKNAIDAICAAIMAQSPEFFATGSMKQSVRLATIAQTIIPTSLAFLAGVIIAHPQPYLSVSPALLAEEKTIKTILLAFCFSLAQHLSVYMLSHLKDLPDNEITALKREIQAIIQDICKDLLGIKEDSIRAASKTKIATGYTKKGGSETITTKDLIAFSQQYHQADAALEELTRLVNASTSASSLIMEIKRLTTDPLTPLWNKFIALQHVITRSIKKLCDPNLEQLLTHYWSNHELTALTEALTKNQIVSNHNSWKSETLARDPLVKQALQGESVFSRALTTLGLNKPPTRAAAPFSNSASISVSSSSTNSIVVPPLTGSGANTPAATSRADSGQLVITAPPAILANHY